jgi:hypothetical protein
MPTAQEIIEAKQEEIANARLIAKRFPDARQVGDDWESESVNRENAKGSELDFLGAGLPGNPQYHLRVYALVQRKGHDPVKVYGTKPYRLTADHVKRLVANNPRVVLRELESVLACQEKSK